MARAPTTTASAPAEVIPAETPAAPVEQDAAEPIDPVEQKAAEPTVDPVAAPETAPVASPAPGMIKLKGSPNSSATVNDTTYDADANGYIDVPAFAVEALFSHGFVVSA